METSETSSEIVPDPQLEDPTTTQEADSRSKKIVTIIIISVVVLLILLGLAIFFLLQPTTPTDRIRDVFIIVVALESLVIGVALIILIVQLASLINLLQNEVRPILKSTSDTVNTLRGTVEFLGENMVEPVIKLNGYLAGMSRVIELMGFNKKK
jgi:heme/copper-type cytochrome/quinol oxidase subunit 2